MKDKLLITEFLHLDNSSELLNEQDLERIKDGELILAGVFQRADPENANGIVYPKNILEKEVKNYQKLIR